MTASEIRRAEKQDQTMAQADDLLKVIERMAGRLEAMAVELRAEAHRRETEEGGPDHAGPVD